MSDLRKSFEKPNVQIDLPEESAAACLVRTMEELGDDIETVVIIATRKNGVVEIFRNKIFNSTALGLIEYAKKVLLESGSQ